MNHLDFAQGLAKEAGDIIRQNFTLAMNKKWKEDNTPLTMTDLAINDLVSQAVKLKYPDYGLISEEGGFYNGQECAWVCDPVDGTIPFSHGVPICTFLLSLIKNGKSILGVSYDPFMDRMYYAEKGRGAYLNGNKIQVSKYKNIHKTAVTILSWPLAKYQYPGLYEEVCKQDVFDIQPSSVGYVDMMVACGEFSAVIFPGESVWDSAAQKIIVEEAGGRFTDLFNREPDFTEVCQGHICTNGILHDYFVGLVKKYLQVR